MLEREVNKYKNAVSRKYQRLKKIENIFCVSIEL